MSDSQSTAIDPQWIAEARALGVEHAQNAASWTHDGNSDVEERRRVLEMLRDGDPAAWDYLPREPNLSGEFADDLTPQRLCYEVGYIADDFYDPDTTIRDAIADAYEDAVSETFGPACESELIKCCES